MVYPTRTLERKALHESIGQPCILFYRKDVYEQAGLQVPQTMDDLVANAAKVHGGDIYGFVGRGMKTQSVAEFGPFLYAYGGEWIDSQRRPAFNSPAGVKALQTYVQLMQNYANPGAAENHWYDELALMQQGETAHIVDTAAWLGVLSNPEKSTVVDKVGFAHVPTVPGQKAKANLWSWNMAISSLSKKKDPAWLFIQWVTGKDMQLFIQSKNFPTARQSAWNSPRVRRRIEPGVVGCGPGLLRTRHPDGPSAVVEVQQIEDVIGTAIVDAILGNKQPQAALDEAAEEVAEIMARTE